MRNTTSQDIRHIFETRLIDEAASATGERLAYEELLTERATLLQQIYITSADKAPNPIMFFNQHRQLLHANPAAIKDIINRDLTETIGMRLGEVFGCDHKMMTIPGEVYRCQNCNSMLSLLSALEGRQATEIRHLLMHPGNAERTVYHISAVPISAGEDHLAMMVFEKMDDPSAI